MTPWKVLVVDDEKEICNDLQTRLTLLGYDVRIGHTMTEGEYLAKNHPVDIAILDMMLPDGNGLQLYQKIKRQHPDVFTIIITGNASLENTIQALNKGVDAFLLKPFPVEALDATLLQATTSLKLKLENRRLQAENSRTRQFFENLLNSTSEAIFVVDLDFNIQYCNLSAEKFLGVEQSELLNQPLQNYIIDGYKVLHHLYHQLMLDKKIGGYPVTLHTNFEKRMEVNLSADFLYGRDGRTEGLIIALENTAFQNELLNQLFRKQQLMTIANLASAIAHEIRNPINILSGRIQLLFNELDEKRYQKTFAILQRQVERISDIVNQLSKFNMNREDTIPESLPMVEFLEKMVDDFSAQFPKLVLEFTASSEARNALVDANRYRMEEVFYSIFQKISSAVGKNTRVTMEAITSKTFSRNPKIQLVLTLPQNDHLVELFEPFKLLSPAEEARSSLDAAILHAILNNYGAQLQVQSLEGDDIQFVIEFPIKAFKGRAQANPSQE